MFKAGEDYYVAYLPPVDINRRVFAFEVDVSKDKFDNHLFMQLKWSFQ
jgi:hypothetical protein